MVGIDIVEIERFAKNYEAMCARICTQSEQIEVKSLQSLAGKFAAKEAISKALRIGISKMGLKNAEILHEENGAPYVVLYGYAKEILGDRELQISISHTEKLATAIALIVSR